MKETKILDEQQPPQGILICIHAGPAINQFSFLAAHDAGRAEEQRRSHTGNDVIRNQRNLKAGPVHICVRSSAGGAWRIGRGGIHKQGLADVGCFRPRYGPGANNLGAGWGGSGEHKSVKRSGWKGPVRRDLFHASSPSSL